MKLLRSFLEAGGQEAALAEAERFAWKLGQVCGLWWGGWGCRWGGGGWGAMIVTSSAGEGLAWHATPHAGWRHRGGVELHRGRATQRGNSIGL